MSMLYYIFIFNVFIDSNNYSIEYSETSPSKNKELYPNIKCILLDNAAHSDATTSYCVNIWFDMVYNWIQT